MQYPDLGPPLALKTQSVINSVTLSANGLVGPMGFSGLLFGRFLVPPWRESPCRLSLSLNSTPSKSETPTVSSLAELNVETRFDGR